MADWLSKIEVRETPPIDSLSGPVRFRVTIRIMRDPRAGAWMKWVVPIITLLYMMSPVNAMPDFQLVTGQLDDLLVAALAMAAMIRIVPLVTLSAIVDEHIEALLKES